MTAVYLGIILFLVLAMLVWCTPHPDGCLRPRLLLALLASIVISLIFSVRKNSGFQQTVTVKQQLRPGHELKIVQAKYDK